MPKSIISKSNKKRFPAKYTRDGKQLDRTNYPRRCQMVVYIEPAGYNKKNGKQAMTSTTRHEFVD